MTKKRLNRIAAALAIGSLTATGCAAPAPDGRTEERVEAHVEKLLPGPRLIATGVLNQTTDLAPVPASDVLENGLPQNVLGGIGSALTSAGGTTFIGIPDRGPNATDWPGKNGGVVDNTTSFISRFETLKLTLGPATAALPFDLSAKLQATTLLYSDTPLVYGATSGIPSAIPVENTADKFYFSGRSDNFGSASPNSSLNPSYARLDPEGIVVSSDGNSVFIADEYGPYVYQFDRLTGRRLHVFGLPDHFAIANLYSVGATEISGNSAGRVTNKGMEGLAITPDGTTLVGLMQSPLIQDGGDGGRANRIVTIDIASGDTHEYVYDNLIGSKAFNSSEIIAFNNHQFLIDTRDGKGLGDGSVAVIKQLWAVDIANAADVSTLSGSATLLAKAVPKVRFLDLVAVLVDNGFTTAQIPAKIEGLAFGDDVTINGVVNHTLYVANDNDFVPNVAGPCRWFVFGFTDDDLAALNFNLTYEPHHITSRDADLTVQEQASATSVVTGSAVNLSVNTTNSGLVPASTVSVTIGAPQLDVTACNTASPATCATQAHSATLSLASLAGDSAQAATVTATMDCSVADGTVITSVAQASFDGTDATVEDDTASVAITATNPKASITGVATSKSVIWPANNSMVPVTVAYDVSDNCPGTTCSLGVSSSEPISEYGFDWSVVDAHNVQLRATRRGNGGGRTYTITISCTDSGGAVSTKTATVLVQKP